MFEKTVGSCVCSCGLDLILLRHSVTNNSFSSSLISVCLFMCIFSVCVRVPHTQIQGCFRASAAVMRLLGLMVSILLIRSLASGVTVSHSGDGNCAKKQESV